MMSESVADKSYVVILDSADDKIEQAHLGDKVRLESWNLKDFQTVDPEKIALVDVLLVWHTVQLGEKELEMCSKLKGIVRMGVGYENVDILAAAQKKVPVANIPAYGVEEVADHTLCLILCMYKDAHNLPLTVGQTNRAERPITSCPRRIRGQTLGIIGFGRIGTAVALRAEQHGFQIVLYDPYLKSASEKSFGFSRVNSLLELVGKSDCIALTCNKTKENEHMINADVLGKMKRGSFIVNTARGGLIDEVALADSLTSGHLAGAALDVHEEEPFNLQTSPLQHCPNLLCTPHSAFYSHESLDEMRNTACEEVLRVLNNQPFRNCVNQSEIDAHVAACIAAEKEEQHQQTLQQQLTANRQASLSVTSQMPKKNTLLGFFSKQ